MNVFEANPKWLLVAVFYAVVSFSSYFYLYYRIHNSDQRSLNCTFRSVTESFNASLKGVYNVTTEQECLSKCSADPECTFLTYYEGRCDVFQDGDDIQDVTFVSKAFSYLFEEQETSCPIAVVSRPQTSTTQPTTAPKSLKYPCNDYPKNYDDDKSFEDPFIMRQAVRDYRPNSFQTVCADYNVDAPNAVAEYRCKGTGQYVYVIDTESGPNPEFPNFGGLERVDTPIFYVHHADKCRSP